MPKQKKRKGGISEKKKKDRSNNTKGTVTNKVTEPSHNPKNASLTISISSDSSVPGSSTATTTITTAKIKDLDSTFRKSSVVPGSVTWVDEICEMAAEAKLSPKSEERILAFAARSGDMPHVTDSNRRFFINPSAGLGEPELLDPGDIEYDDGVREYVIDADEESSHSGSENNISGEGGSRLTAGASRPITSNARLLDQKISETTTKPGKWIRQTVSDHFVGASLVGDVHKLVHLRCRVAIDCTNRKWGWTALMAAAGNGHLPCVRYLVKCSANVNMQDRSGWTALMLAARASQLDVVEYLIRCGADIKLRTSNHQTVYGLGDRGLVSAAIQRGLETRMKRETVQRLTGESTGESKHKPIIKWNWDDVSRWLRIAGCESTRDYLRDYMIDGEALLDISKEEFESFGIEDKATRRRLWGAIERLRKS
mmetsp:Transcript_4797/g.11389  ORF Transcript_4797/g.11389 Transcript_4797/m.11389 type:complete len:426 (+) Transcript_4797:74-1351(+)